MDEFSKSLLAGDDSRKDKLPLMAGETINADSQGSSEKRLIDSLRKMLDAESNKNRGQSIPCIFSIPEKLRTKKESDYKPRVISIGPHYYKHDKVLEGMEVHKTNYMHYLFKRRVRVTPSLSLDKVVTECVGDMLKTVAKARTCYATSFPYDDEQFTKIMIVDGCFILELLYSYHCLIQHKGMIEPSDPILGNQSVLNDVKRDLFLLENQIPFFVLETIFKVTLMQIENPPLQLTHLIRQFFGNVLNSELEFKNYKQQEDTRHGCVTHILGFLHMCYLPSKSEPNGDVKNFNMVNYSATDLDREGVNFLACKGDNMIDVEFNTSCWFDRLCGQRTPSKIPTFFVFNPNRSCCFVSRFCQLFGKTRLAITPLRIYDVTESFLRNLIAYEQCYPFAGHHISSYAYLMDTIIDNEQDVQLLVREKVLINNLGSPKDAVDLFNNLCKEVIVDPWFMNQWKQVDEYCSRFWPRHIAGLKRTYFNTPWSGIAFVVAVFITICQFIQTFKSFGFLKVQSLLKYE